jgi:sec-independent protein translocase protein TatA
MSLMFVSLHAWQIILLLGIGVLLFGSRLPSIARSLGKSVVEFKKGVKDVKDDLNVDVDEKSESKKLKDESASEVTAKRELPAEKVEKSETENSDAEKVSS